MGWGRGVRKCGLIRRNIPARCSTEEGMTRMGFQPKIDRQRQVVSDLPDLMGPCINNVMGEGVGQKMTKGREVA